MADYRLDLIKQYFDTSGVRLHDYQKDLLCRVLNNPGYYNGFESPIYEARDSGRDYRDTWNSCTSTQYQISISYGHMSIKKRYMHECDGYCQNGHWDWNNAFYYDDIKGVIGCLESMENDL